MLRFSVINALKLIILLIVLGVGLFWKDLAQGPFFWIVAASFSLSLAILLASKMGAPTQRLAWALVLGDSLLISLLVGITGGPQSPFIVLYSLVVIVAAVLLGRQGLNWTILVVTIGLTVIYWYPLWVEGEGFVPEEAFFFFLDLGAFCLVGLMALRLVRDVTVAQDMARRSREDVHRLKKIQDHVFHSLRSGLIITDAKGQIQLVNRRAEEILGRDLSSVLGVHLKEAFPELADLDCHQRQDLELRLPDGRELVLGLSCFEITDDKGTPLGMGIIFQDITEIKRRERQMRRIERLAALGHMADGLVHEIRNPLTSISGAAQLLREQGLVATEGEPLLEIILREAKRLESLSDDFFLFARPEKGKKVVFSPAQVAEEVISLVGRHGRFKQISIENNLAEDLKVVLDPGQFRQVLLNLVMNAAEACNGHQPGRVVISARKEGKGLWLEVKDTGRGIPSEVLEHIFDPFYTTRPEGTGLGLSIVHRLVEAWGGEIRVESQPGKGTSFQVFIPQEKY
ncbi:two-component system sensor histidine kinase NtrB [Thermosulfuriphilus sp.]